MKFCKPYFLVIWFGIDPENFVKKYCIVQKLDHLTCSKCLFMTLLYNMYKPINCHSGLFSELRYMSNGPTFKILNGNFANFFRAVVK